MEQKNKHQAQDHAREENNGQHITVRPGNFAPPGTPIEQKGAQGSNAQGNHAHGQGGHHRGRRGGRNRHGADKRREAPNAASAAESRPNQPQQKQGNQPQQKQGNQPQQKQGNQPQQKQGNQPQQKQGQGQGHQNHQGHPADKGAQGGRNRRNRNRHGEKEQKPQVKEEAASVISDTLRRELEEEFATPTLSPVGSLFADRKKQTEEVLDSEEFAVDIATASYLTEDVPCGFPIPDGSKAVEVIGVRFRSAGRMYFFSPEGKKYGIGQRVIVDTARGNELGDVVMLNRHIAEKNVVQPLRAVIRLATKEDEAHERENQQKEVEALKICAERIKQHELDMRLVDAQYTFDNSKLLFYFTSEGRVDFRELVRDLAGCFRTRIELRQIGIRDESRLVGGLGMCGRPFCCSTFLSDFGQVSVKMAKEQGLSINASKISGCCGRLMCCLRYEQDTYQAEAKLTPKKDAVVNTPDGRGIVVDSTPLLGLVKVKLDGQEEAQPQIYHRDKITVIPRCPQAQECKEKAEQIQSEADAKSEGI